PEKRMPWKILKTPAIPRHKYERKTSVPPQDRKFKMRKGKPRGIVRRFQPEYKCLIRHHRLLARDFAHCADGQIGAIRVHSRTWKFAFSYSSAPGGKTE
ncbi:MAG TPA: hypothetical protein VH724_14340, partial [Candidatus Angelobacter sp.]|nr:hypothetical protein [Candidatus Angelobacter sp.]